MRSCTMIRVSDKQHLTRNRTMSEAKATKCADKMSRETGMVCKVIHLGDQKFQAVIVGSTKHRQSVGH
jgi:hypothetical protein